MLFNSGFVLAALGVITTTQAGLLTPEVYSLPKSVFCGTEETGFEIKEKVMHNLIATTDRTVFKTTTQRCGDTILPKNQFKIYTIKGHQDGHRFVLKFGYGKIPDGVQQVVYCDAYVGGTPETIELCAFS